jgi:hypothetical protein
VTGVAIRLGVLVVAAVITAASVVACGASSEAVQAANDRRTAEAAQAQAAADRASAEAAAAQAAVDRAATEKAIADAAAAAKASLDKAAADKAAAQATPTTSSSPLVAQSKQPPVAPFVQITGSSYRFVSALVGPVVGPGLNPFCTASETYGFDGGGIVLSSTHNGGAWSWQFSLVRWTRVSGTQGKNTVTCKWDDGTSRSASAFFAY